MHKLIKLQLRNIFQSKLIYICLLLMIILGPVATAAIGNSFSDIIGKVTICDEILSVLSVGIIATIFIALVSCSDFNEGTTKNIIARGYTRTQLLISKYISILISLLIMFIVTILFIFILLFKNKFGFENDMIYKLINSIISIVAYTVFYTTMGFLLEKNSSAILACLFLPKLLPTVLSLLEKVLHFKISKYWMEYGTDIFYKNPTLNNFGISIIYYSIYVFVFLIIGTQLLKNKEIK